RTRLRSTDHQIHLLALYQRLPARHRSHHPEEIHHLPASRIPIMRPLRLHPDKGDLRIIHPSAEPGPVQRIPQLTDLPTIIEDIGDSRYDQETDLTRMGVI